MADAGPPALPVWDDLRCHTPAATTQARTMIAATQSRCRLNLAQVWSVVIVMHAALAEIRSVRFAISECQ
jgi:hypothetical protein